MFSERSRLISSLSNKFNSFNPLNLSLATLDSIRSIIFNVVFTPTSLEIRISSRSSRKSLSIFDLPTMILFNFEKKEVLDFSNPLSKESFLELEKIFLKKLILI
ncbi:MAG: Uncharacterised protein [Flavobacteriaceae bacterium]|nr:MAG: Uncharacterised protein [Flavobacteriaceae bacterium]